MVPDGILTQYGEFSPPLAPSFRSGQVFGGEYWVKQEIASVLSHEQDPTLPLPMFCQQTVAIEFREKAAEPIQ